MLKYFFSKVKSESTDMYLRKVKILHYCSPPVIISYKIIIYIIHFIILHLIYLQCIQNILIQNYAFLTEAGRKSQTQEERPVGRVRVDVYFAGVEGVALFV